MIAALIGHGRMGRLIEKALTEGGDQIAGIVDIGLFASLADIPGPIDVALDFSYPGNLEKTLSRAVEIGCALVVGTTGLTERQIGRIESAAKQVPVVWSSNYSLGVAVLRRAVRLVAPMLPDFDVEIVETHHNQKADAPSGTAKMLIAEIDPAGEKPLVYGREGAVGARGREIGVHALRGGTEAGTHSVFFFGDNETLEFKHAAQSRQIFVNGAVRAARFVVGQKPGLYTMDDVLGGGMAE